MANSPTDTRSRIRFALLTFSLALLAFMSLCYGFRFDSCTAVTVWPIWIWPIPGLLLALVALSKRTKRAVGITLILWLVFLGAFAEEPRSLLGFGAWPTAEWQTARKRGQAVRVVSLNCAGGSKEAAEEVAAYDPDIVLLQESPTRNQVDEVARHLFGKRAGSLVGLDASIIAHGRVNPEPLSLSLRAYLSAARVRLDSGLESEIVSIRLTPSTFRTDIWSPDCWREFSDNRRFRRRQMEAVAQLVADLPERLPVILGGDMNAPQGDAVFRLLEPRLHDSFGEGGRGWGNTIINDFPALRIDQVWVSSHFQAAPVSAHKTRNSDHRLVVCDLWVR